MNLSAELESLKTWWHTLIDHLFKHPQAATVAPAVIAAAGQASQPPTQAAATAPHPSVTDLLFPQKPTAPTVVPAAPPADRSGFDFAYLGNVKENTLEAGKPYVFVAHLNCTTFQLQQVPSQAPFSCQLSGAASWSGPVIGILATQTSKDNPATFTVVVDKTDTYAAQVN